MPGPSLQNKSAVTLPFFLFASVGISFACQVAVGRGIRFGHREVLRSSAYGKRGHVVAAAELVRDALAVLVQDDGTAPAYKHSAKTFEIRKIWAKDAGLETLKLGKGGPRKDRRELRI